MSSSQPNRQVWFFRLRDGGNQCTEYVTRSKSEAMRCLKSEYGVVASDAVRRELTFEEYSGLLRCNPMHNGGDAYEAIQDFFFRCDPRAGE